MREKRELTPEEKSEREALRNEYRRSVIANLTGQLEATTIIEPDGSRIKVSDMKRSGEDKNKVTGVSRQKQKLLTMKSFLRPRQTKSTPLQETGLSRSWATTA